MFVVCEVCLYRVYQVLKVKSLSIVPRLELSSRIGNISQLNKAPIMFLGLQISFNNQVGISQQVNL